MDFLLEPYYRGFSLAIICVTLPDAINAIFNNSVKCWDGWFSNMHMSWRILKKCATGISIPGILTRVLWIEEADVGPFWKLQACWSNKPRAPSDTWSLSKLASHVGCRNAVVYPLLIQTCAVLIGYRYIYIVKKLIIAEFESDYVKSVFIYAVSFKRYMSEANMAS